MAQAMRDRAIQLRSRHARFIDTAGTGSSRAKNFQCLDSGSFRHRRRWLARRKTWFTSGDIALRKVLTCLRHWALTTAASPETVEHCFNEHGICFIFAPLFHRASARVAHIRRELGLRTTFNLLGPLTNPARAPFSACWRVASFTARANRIGSVSSWRGESMGGAWRRRPR